MYHHKLQYCKYINNNKISSVAIGVALNFRFQRKMLRGQQNMKRVRFV